MILIKMGVVLKVVQADKPLTSKELAEKCGADELLISTYQI